MSCVTTNKAGILVPAEQRTAKFSAEETTPGGKIKRNKRPASLTVTVKFLPPSQAQLNEIARVLNQLIDQK